MPVYKSQSVSPRYESEIDYVCYMKIHLMNLIWPHLQPLFLTNHTFISSFSSYPKLAAVWFSPRMKTGLGGARLSRTW